MLYVATEGNNNDYYGGHASISLGSTGDSIAIQLRGNQDNNDIVTLVYKRKLVFSQC